MNKKGEGYFWICFWLFFIFLAVSNIGEENTDNESCFEDCMVGSSCYRINSNMSPCKKECFNICYQNKTMESLNESR